METLIASHKAKSDFFEHTLKVLFILSVVFLSMVALTVFQDFLELKRNGIYFNFDESLLFKNVWLLFIPILFFLYKRLQHQRVDSHIKALAFIVLAIVIHMLLLPLVSVLFSILFYQGRYNLYKFFSYTLAHDLYKLVLVYASFVLGYQHFSNRPQNINIKTSKPILATLVVNNGKENTIVNVDDIVQITSATPYVFIHLQNKKYLHSQTLKSICKKLDSNIFVQVHKSTIVNISKISSFKSRLNGDYDLQLKSGELLRLSRTYASAFKNQFGTSKRVSG